MAESLGWVGGNQSSMWCCPEDGGDESWNRSAAGEERLDIAMDIHAISPAFETALPLLGTGGRTSKG